MNEMFPLVQPSQTDPRTSNEKNSSVSFFALQSEVFPARVMTTYGGGVGSLFYVTNVVGHFAAVTVILCAISGSAYRVANCKARRLAVNLLPATQRYVDRGTFEMRKSLSSFPWQSRDTMSKHFCKIPGCLFVQTHTLYYITTLFCTNVPKIGTS